MQVLAPCTGRVVALADVDDPVFATGAVGPGVGIIPADGHAAIVAPADGMLLKLDPHMFILLDGEIGVLVHIGINTVKLDGAGFTLLAEQGQQVAAGTPIVEWDPAEAEQNPDVSRTVLVVAMDQDAADVVASSVGEDVATGDLLLTVG